MPFPKLEDYPETCEVCGTNEREYIIGISRGMAGYDYVFCIHCLKSRTAYEIFTKLGIIDK